MTVVTVHRALGRGGLRRPVLVEVDGATEVPATRKQPATFDLPPGRHRIRARFGLHRSNVLTVDVDDQPLSILARPADVPNLHMASEPLLLEPGDPESYVAPGLFRRPPISRWTLPLGVLLTALGILQLVAAALRPDQVARWVVGVLLVIAGAMKLARWARERRRPAQE